MKAPYEKPELITQLMSSETLRAQCSDPVEVTDGFVAFGFPACESCADCSEGSAS
jgi:hypothetical protein